MNERLQSPISRAFPNLLFMGILVYWAVLSYLLLSPEPLWFLTGSGFRQEDFYVFTMSDLIQHSVVFAVLSSLIRLYRERNERTATSLIVLAIAFAFVSEFIQLFIPGRFFDLFDVLSNLAGLALGWWSLVIIRSIFMTSSLSYQK